MDFWHYVITLEPPSELVIEAQPKIQDTTHEFDPYTINQDVRTLLERQGKMLSYAQLICL